LRTLHGPASCTVTPEADLSERFSVHIKARDTVSVADLPARLAD
jgi:hypothetical protein